MVIDKWLAAFKLSAVFALVYLYNSATAKLWSTKLINVGPG